METNMTKTTEVPTAKLEDLIKQRIATLEADLHVVRSRMALMKEGHMLQKCRERVISLEQALYTNKSLIGEFQ